MNMIAVSEINRNGLVLATSSPRNLSFSLPKSGDNLFSFWDGTEVIAIQGLVDNAFASFMPQECTLNIGNNRLDIMVHCTTADKAFVYWKNITAQVPNQEELLQMVGFAFQKVNTAIIFTTFDRTIFHFNEAAYQLLGYTKEAFAGLKIDDLSTKFSLEQWEQQWDLLRSIGSCSFPCKTLKKDGATVDVEIHIKRITYGNTEFHCSFINDITERVKTEERMQLVDFAFKHSSTPIQLINSDGSYYDFNQSMHSLLGYSREEFAQLDISDVAPYHRKELWPKHWASLKLDKSISVISQLKAKDGRLIDVDVSASYIAYGDMEINFSFVSDITEKKKTEEILKLHEISFKKADTPMNLIKEDGSFYDFNDAAHNLLGYTREEYYAKRVSDIDPHYNAERWPHHWQELQEAGSLTFPTQLIHKNGTLIEVEINVNMVKHAGYELNFSCVTNITDRVRSAEALKKSNERYEYAIAATSDAIYEVDMRDNSVFFSPRYFNMLGYSTYEFNHINNNQWLENIHQDDRKKIGQTIEAVMTGALESWREVYRMIKNDGNYITVIDRGFGVKDTEGKVMRLIGSIQDITVKKKEEERLKLIETVITNTTDAVIIRNAQPNENGGLAIVFVNEAFTNMTGYRFEEVEGKTLQMLNGPLTGRTERTKLREAINQFKPGKMEVVNYKKDGTPFWVSVSIFPVANNEGIFTHWVSIQRDITSRKVAEQEKELLLLELIQSNNELKQFSYITTHNLRSPLTNLLSICKLLNTETISNPRTVKLIEGFKTSTQHLNDTLNDLINILIIKENPNLPTGQLSFNAVLQTVLTSIANIVKEASIEVDFSLAPSVAFNGAYLESIFLNLITNSIKYAQPELKPSIVIQTFPSANGGITMTFSDNGRGFNMEQVRDRVFGLYQRFHDNADSKGIGLYIIHAQITALGGSIEVNSQVNEGTTFTIRFK